MKHANHSQLKAEEEVMVYTESPGSQAPNPAPPQPTILPDIFSSSITDMLPDSQSDIASPHVWQRLYNRRCVKMILGSEFST